MKLYCTGLKCSVKTVQLATYNHRNYHILERVFSTSTVSFEAIDFNAKQDQK